MARGDKEVFIRNLNLRDIKDVMKVEKMSWPKKLAASEEKLKQRLEMFPEGFIGAFLNNELVGFGTSQIISLINPNHLEK